MDKDKLNSFVKKLVEENKKEELNVLWSFVFSGCDTGFRKFTNEAKEHFAKIFKQSLELKYNESDPFRIIDNIIKPMELCGLDVKNIYNDRIIVIHALLSNKADKILIDELKEKIKNLKEGDKDILDIVFAFVHVNKSDIDNIIDKFYIQSLDNVNYINVDINAVRGFLIKFKNINKTYNEITNIFVSNGFILSPYIASSSALTSENIIVPLFLLDVYVNDFLKGNFIDEIKSWQEKEEKELKMPKTEQKEEYDSWGKGLKEREEIQKQLQIKLNSYISDLVQKKNFIAVDIISTLAFTPTAKSYVDINNNNNNRAEEFREWLQKLAIENIKIKHSLKEREAKNKVNETFDNFFDTFHEFLSYEYYDYNLSVLYNILKNLLEIENEIRNRLESLNEREKKAVSFLIEYANSEPEFLDRKNITFDSNDWSLGKCNQIINQIFIEENYGKTEPFKRRTKEIMPLMGAQIKIEDYPRFEIGDIAVKSGLGFWSPYITGSSNTGFNVVITFPTWLLTKSWKSLPIIPDFKQKIIEVESKEKPQKFSESIKELKIYLDECSPFEFENFVSLLFQKMGYQTSVTRKTGDYGIDVIAKKDGLRIGIQCKKNSPQNLVGNRVVRDTLGSMDKYKLNECILITTSDFTPQAKEQARDAPIELWNRAELEEKIKKYLLF